MEKTLLKSWSHVWWWICSHSWFYSQLNTFIKQTLLHNRTFKIQTGWQCKPLWHKQHIPFIKSWWSTLIWDTFFLEKEEPSEIQFLDQCLFLFFTVPVLPQLHLIKDRLYKFNMPQDMPIRIKMSFYVLWYLQTQLYWDVLYCL